MTDTNEQILQSHAGLIHRVVMHCNNPGSAPDLEQVLQQNMARTADEGAALAAEARQLTLPGMMGERFQVMGLGRGLETEPAAFSLRDLRYRL